MFVLLFRWKLNGFFKSFKIGFFFLLFDILNFNLIFLLVLMYNVVFLEICGVLFFIKNYNFYLNIKYFLYDFYVYVVFGMLINIDVNLWL